MAGSWGNGLKTPVNDSLHKNFKFGPLFGYHNFENQINTWETTVEGWENAFFAMRKRSTKYIQKTMRPRSKVKFPLKIQLQYLLKRCFCYLILLKYNYAAKCFDDTISCRCLFLTLRYCFVGFAGTLI